MAKSRGWRKILRVLAFGCGTIALLFGAFVVWVGIDIYRATQPVELSDHHPFRSAAKKQRYLAHYDARAERWPVVSETRMVDTSWGPTFVRISGPTDGPPLVLLPGANATSLMWETNIEAFSRDHRVYAVDNIFDFGRSVYIRNLETPADFVSWLDELRRCPRPRKDPPRGSLLWWLDRERVRPRASRTRREAGPHRSRGHRSPVQCRLHQKRHPLHHPAQVLRQEHDVMGARRRGSRNRRAPSNRRRKRPTTPGSESVASNPNRWSPREFSATKNSAVWHRRPSFWSAKTR